MKIRIPLQRYFLDGIECHRPLLTLRVRGNYGAFAPLPFFLDTGAELTSIPIPMAEREGIPFQRTIEVPTVGLVGRTTSFRHILQVAIGKREYDWPCNFVNTPPGAKASTAVLGRMGFLDAFNFGIYDQHLFLTRRGSFADRMDRVWSALGRLFVRERSSSELL